LNALTPILQRARAEVERRRAVCPLPEVRAAGQERRISEAAGYAPVRSFADALSGPGLSVIAEHKRRSPSAGVIREELALEDVVVAYERAGAAALSILTESESFGGALEDLGRARAVSVLPILRKDFVIDAYQISEAVAAGADAILLIVAALPAGELADLYAEAIQLGLDVLVEVHDAAELAVARELGAMIIGINNRDLTTLRVDIGRTLALAPEVGANVLVVAESGFRTRVELEGLVGTFSGIGRLRADLSGDPDFAAVVTRVRDRVLGMFENQDIPFMQVRRALLPEFPTGGPALIAALPTDFQYFHTGDLPGQEIHFRGQLSYKLDYYEPATIARLAGDLQLLLDAVAADPGRRLSELPLTPRW